MKAPHILAISSFAVHGTASLKSFTAILGEKILPVPSIMLNGLTNMSLVRKFDTPFRELLQGTFELVVNRELEIILYIGYLGKPDQADIILEMIDRYRDSIKIIITDPVCGDHGRKYVPDEMISQWPKLIRLSDMVFPNLTELKMLTGHQPGDDSETPAYYIKQFAALFPRAQLVATSIKKTDDTIGLEAYGAKCFSYSHPMLAKSYGGSGDAFLALFLLNYFYKQAGFEHSLKIAADAIWQIIKNSIEKESEDLILDTTISANPTSSLI